MSARGLPRTSPASEVTQGLPASGLGWRFPEGPEDDAPPYVVIDTDTQLPLITRGGARPPLGPSSLTARCAPARFNLRLGGGGPHSADNAGLPRTEDRAPSGRAHPWRSLNPADVHSFRAGRDLLTGNRLKRRRGRCFFPACRSSGVRLPARRSLLSPEAPGTLCSAPKLPSHPRGPLRPVLGRTAPLAPGGRCLCSSGRGGHGGTAGGPARRPTCEGIRPWGEGAAAPACRQSSCCAFCAGPGAPERSAGRDSSVAPRVGRSSFFVGGRCCGGCLPGFPASGACFGPRPVACERGQGRPVGVRRGGGAAITAAGRSPVPREAGVALLPQLRPRGHPGSHEGCAGSSQGQGLPS
uniref:uncharacterized protein LOC118543442 n=1 Tax=Halichoerus grypus TaxID=9711 RepID=UPI001659EA50|nr:uncharacterized protein LOC118543442 [Halichoerus grypus]